MAASFPTDRIFLKRLDRKLWRFGSASPKRVELAVLDYYKSKGWEGYFTEHYDYFSIIGFISGWGEWTKKRPKTATSLHLILKNVGYGRTLKNIENTDEELLRTQIKDAKPCLKNYFEFYRISEFNDQDFEVFTSCLLSFFNTVGADGLAKEIQRRFPEERIKRERIVERFDFKINDFRRKNKLDYSITPLRLVLHYREGFFDRLSGLEEVPVFAQKYGDEAFIRLADKAVAAAKLELERIQAAIQYRVLDLVLWKEDRVAYVEVKAPNDRLSEEQCSTIRRNVGEGSLSWVTYVEEAGVG